MEEGVALTGRNHTGPPCSVDRPRARHIGGRPLTRPAAGPLARRQRYIRRQTTTTDASELNNTGPLGGPVLSHFAMVA